MNVYLPGNSRWGPRFRILPEPQMLQDLTDDRLLLDEGDNLHGVSAFGTEQQIDYADLPDQL